MDNNNKNSKKNLGLSVKKYDNISEWYSEVVIKSELADYSKVSGCIVYRPLSYGIWENIQEIFNFMIKSSGHKNVYFPMLIPESLLLKEKEHIEGFSPEVAWVTEAGNSKLNEKLAIRPTSETIIYDSYSKWIRSHRDLPLLLNQWCSVVRWEFKHPKPFLRGREFLWQEGHTAHASFEDAEKEVFLILNYYKDLIQNYLAIPVIEGYKSSLEKFAGAHYTTALESFMPDGKALQMATSHHLGQNFSKPFEIKFFNKKGEEEYVYTTSWGLSTRTIGALVLVHGDDKGLVLPPKIAPVQIVIVPIFKEDNKSKVLEFSEKIYNALKDDFKIFFDDRENYTPGWKFNESELKGYPLRLEIGIKEVEDNIVTVFKRNTFEKLKVNVDVLKSKIKTLLDDIQKELFENAKKLLYDNIVKVDSLDEFESALKNNKLIYAGFCGSEECESKIKEQFSITSRVIPFDSEEKNCIVCSKKGKYAYFSKSH